MQKTFDEFIKLANFNGNNSARYADEPLKAFFDEWQTPYTTLMDQRIKEGGLKTTVEERQVTEEGIAICEGKFVKQPITRTIRTESDNRITSDCINMALYFRDKVDGLLMVGAYCQGHSMVLHLDDNNNVVVTCPYLNTVKGFEHYALPFKEYIAKFPDIRSENAGFSVFKHEGMTESEMTLRDVLDRKYPHVQLAIDDPERLDAQLDDARQLMLDQKPAKQKTITPKSKPPAA